MFTFSEVYNMPIYLRKFYFKRIDKYYKDKNKKIEEANKKVKQPTFKK